MSKCGNEFPNIGKYNWDHQLGTCVQTSSEYPQFNSCSDCFNAHLPQPPGPGRIPEETPGEYHPGPGRLPLDTKNKREKSILECNKYPNGCWTYEEDKNNSANNKCTFNKDSTGKNCQFKTCNSCFQNSSNAVQISGLKNSKSSNSSEESSDKSFFQKPLGISLIVLFLILLGVGIYYGYKHMKKNDIVKQFQISKK